MVICCWRLDNHTNNGFVMEERTIDISNDYKPQIKEDISTSDVFFEQYRTASDILENILSVYASIKDKTDNSYNKIE